MRKALGAPALILAFSLVALGAVAAQPPSALGAPVLSEVRLKSGPRTTELSLAVSDLGQVSVAREGASGLAVKLAGAQAAASLKTAGLKDALVASVAVAKSASGLVVRVKGRVKALGYIQTRSGSGVSLQLFADASGGDAPADKGTPAQDKSAKAKPAVTKPAPTADKPAAKKAAPQDKAKTKDKDKAKPPGSSQDNARAKDAATKGDQAVERAQAAAESPKRNSGAKAAQEARSQAARSQAADKLAASKSAASPADKLSAGLLAGLTTGPVPAGPMASPLLGGGSVSRPTRADISELPVSGPDLGGVLPGSRPSSDPLFDRLGRGRQSETAYAAIVARMMASDYRGAQGLCREVAANFPGSLAAARAVYRQADCLCALAKGPTEREAAVQAYLQAASRWPLRDEVARAYLQVGRLYIVGGLDYEALSYLGMAVKAQPDGPYALHVYLARGDLYFHLGDYAKARDEYTQVGRRFPNSVLVRQANFKLVQSLFALRDFDGVARAYREMRERWPETFAADPQLLLYIGETYFFQGDYRRARDFLFYVLNIYPGMTANHLVLCRIGDAYLADGRLGEATKIYRLLISTFPNTEGARLGRMRLAEGDLTEGRPLVDALVSGEKRLGELKLYQEIAAGRGPVAEQAKVRVGLWHYWRRDYLRSAQVLQALVAQDRELPPDLAQTCRYATAEALFRLVRTYFDQGRYAEVVRLDESWGKWLGSERAEAYYYLGESYRRLHLASEAIKEFVRAQQLPWREDQRAPTLYGLGMARLETGDYAEAAKALQQLADTYPAYPGRLATLRALAKAHYLGRKYQLASGVLEQVLRADPRSSEAAADLNLLGLSLMGLKDFGRAQAAFEQAVAAGGASKTLQAEASFNLGNALFGQGRYEDAARSYSQAVRLAPGGAQAQQALYKEGKCYLALGRRKEAATAFGQGSASGDDGLWKKASTQMLEGLNVDVLTTP